MFSDVEEILSREDRKMLKNAWLQLRLMDPALAQKAPIKIVRNFLKNFEDQKHGTSPNFTNNLEDSEHLHSELGDTERSGLAQRPCPQLTL